MPQINSINTNLAAYAAQTNIRIASSNATKSVARLSSGNRITQAADDVAGLAIGTSLATNVRTLRTALTNASQAVSLLQVADAALSQITEILQRQKAIAVQAGSGTLGTTERSFLNAEFTALTSEIDRIAENTNFNNVRLINGALSAAAKVENTATNASAGGLTISFNNTIADGETVIINGVTLTAETDTSVTGLEFAVGSTIADTVANLAAKLNSLSEDNSLVDGSAVTAANKLALSQAKYAAVGNNLVITSRTGGSLSDSFRVSSLGTATVVNEADLNGSFGGIQFNLFSSTATGASLFSSADTVISATTAAPGTPFQNGDSIALTVNGVARNLFTLTAGQGTGTSGNYTLRDIVNGINSNKLTTGVGAELEYTSAGTYNIRLDLGTQTGVVVASLGTNYNSDTYKLSGDQVDLSAGIVTTADVADANTSVLFADGFRALTNADLTPTTATLTDDIVDATPDNTDDFFVTGNQITATVNGQTHVLHTFAAADTFATIIAGINSQTATTGIYAQATSADAGVTGFGIRLYVSDPSGVAAASGINLQLGAGNAAEATSTAGTVIAGTTNITRTTVFGLDGGANDGIGLGNVSASGSTGDNILTDFGNSKALAQLLFTQNASAGENIFMGNTTFIFTTNTSGAANEILIGATLKDSLDNAVNTINSYLLDGHALGTAANELNQLDIRRDGEKLLFSSKKVENVLDLSGSASTVTTSVTGATSAGSLTNNSTTFGVKVDGVSNSAFSGTISGFQATYTGTTDRVDLSITVGDYTYTAQNVDITVSTATTIRFLSDEATDGSNGGYFDLQLRAGQVVSVQNQAAADEVASRLDSAFSSISFVQQRNISSYTGSQGISVDGTVIGSLFGTKVSAQLADFENLKITDVAVNSPQGSATDSKITLTIGGVNYSSAAGLGTKLGANQTFRLTSEEDPNQFIDFTTGDVAIQLDSDEKAAAVESALKAAFGATSGSASISFQVGTSTDDTLSVSISDSKTETLFQGATLDVLTQETAAVAVAAIDVALQVVTSVRASVGALQSRFNFASANIESSIQNQDAARGTLLDTDIADESTVYATNQVKLQAGISVLAQANQQVQALLKLIG